jgi:hypothetical protein
MMDFLASCALPLALAACPAALSLALATTSTCLALIATAGFGIFSLVGQPMMLVSHG